MAGPGLASARAVLEAYETRINQHDFDVLVELIAPDAVFWFSDGSHRGLPAIRAAFEATWNTLRDETYWLDELQWIAESDVAAACIYRFNWKTMVDGQPVSGSGRGTTVLNRSEGALRIVHEHLSHGRG